MNDQFVIGLILGAVALLTLCVIVTCVLYARARDDDGERDVRGEINGFIDVVARRAGDGTSWRQRYECTCGFHGAREHAFPPRHIKCPRCGGVAVARGVAELVT